MNRILRSSLPIFMAALLILAITNCGADKEETKAPENVPETEPAVADYFGKGVVLAAFIWEDGFMTGTFFPAEIVTQASDKTEGEYEVVSLAGSPDVTKGAKHWTKNVSLKSHPVKKEELKVGQIVLYTGDVVVIEDYELKEARWSRGLITDISGLYKNTVEIEAGEYQRKYEINIKNIRISDDPVIKGPPK